MVREEGEFFIGGGIAHVTAVKNLCAVINPVGKIKKMPTQAKRTMHAYPPNQPDLPRKGGVLLIELVALVVIVALVVLVVLVARVWGVVHPGRGLGAFELVRRSLHQGGGLGAWELARGS